MNSFLSLRTQKSSKFFATISTLLFLGTGSALAQDATSKVPSIPALPVVSDDVAVTPPVNIPNGAKISDAETRNKELAAEAAKKLDTLVGGISTSERNDNDIKTLAARQRKLMDLNYQLEVAKVSSDLWKTLNPEQGKEEKIKELEEKIKQLTDANAALETKANAALMAGAQVNRPVDPDPVVAEISGAGGNVEAKILVPYAGEFMAHAGDTLPNGMKVTSVTKNGVTVVHDGNKKLLSFGTSVPLSRPVTNIIQVPPGAQVFPQ